MSGSSTQPSLNGCGCYFASSFILSSLSSGLVSIVALMICVIKSGDVVGSLEIAGLCGLATLIFCMWTAYAIYVALYYIKKSRLKKNTTPTDGEGEYVEFEEIIEEDQYNG